MGMILPKGSNPVIIPFPHHIIIFMIKLYLFRYRQTLLLRYFGYIQLIAEGACQRHMSPGLKGRHPANCMVRAVAYMCADGRQRIQQRRSLLDAQPFHGVSIIRAPDLRAVVQHSRVKPGTASGAVFQKKPRKFCNKPFLKLINAQHIAVKQLSLPVIFQGKASHITELAVHIPFYIGYICTSKHSRNHFIYIIHNFLPG